MTGSFNFSATESSAASDCVGRGEGPGTSRTSDGKVQFENDNYRIAADDNNEVTLFNKQTGESYRIWGDPHVEIDGKHAFDFWGNTTFVLDDGTRVSIATTPWRSEARRGGKECCRPGRSRGTAELQKKK